MKNEKIITALTNLRAAHNELQAAWDETDLNTTAAIAKYPFNRSFDELNVSEWVEETIEELQAADKLQKFDYKVLSHQYENTGGGCMVSTFQVWLPAQNKTVFVHVNEEGGSMATCDYICNDIEYDESMMLDYFQTNNMTAVTRYFELYRYCVMEYIKKDCKRYGYYTSIPFHILPEELQQQMTIDYIEWHKEEIGNEFKTNGFEMQIEDSYVEPDADIIAAKEFLQYMNDEFAKTDVDNNQEVLDKFYSLKATITFGDKTFSTENSAAIFTGIQDCLKYFIEQY